MTSRCIVSVATGGYVNGQAKLNKSLGEQGWDGQWIAWSGAYPPGSPPHEDIPYGFKLFAINEARRRGYTTVIWADSGVRAVRPLGPFCELIEREGHFFFDGGEYGAKLGARAGDHCLNAFGMSRTRAMSYTLIGGTLYGFDFTNARTNEFFDAWAGALSLGLWNGPAINEMHRHKPGGLAGRPVGWCSDDPRCEGHSHDEAVATVLAIGLQMKSYPINGRYFARHGEGGEEIYLTTGGP